MFKKTLLLTIVLSSIFANSVDINSNGTNSEFSATADQRLNKFFNGFFTLGYLKSEDEFKKEQSMFYVEAIGINVKPLDRWTFGLGAKALRASINNSEIIALPMKAKAFYHIPVRRRVYASFSYLYAPGLLVFSDNIRSYNELEMDINVAMRKNTILYFGVRNIKFTDNSQSNYEFSNSGYIGIKYYF